MKKKFELQKNFEEVTKNMAYIYDGLNSGEIHYFDFVQYPHKHFFIGGVITDAPEEAALEAAEYIRHHFKHYSKSVYKRYESFLKKKGYSVIWHADINEIKDNMDSRTEIVEKVLVMQEEEEEPHGEVYNFHNKGYGLEIRLQFDKKEKEFIYKCISISEEERGKLNFKSVISGWRIESCDGFGAPAIKLCRYVDKGYKEWTLYLNGSKKESDGLILKYRPDEIYEYRGKKLVVSYPNAFMGDRSSMHKTPEEMFYEILISLEELGNDLEVNEKLLKDAQAHIPRLMETKIKDFDFRAAAALEKLGIKPKKKILRDKNTSIMTEEDKGKDWEEMSQKEKFNAIVAKI